MASTTTARLRTPEEIAMTAGQQVPYLHLPDRSSVFAEREMRLRQRAANHAMGDFLRFMADVAAAQQACLSDHPVLALPDATALQAAAAAGLPPLPAAQWQRDAAWQTQLQRLLKILAATAAPPALAVIERLATADPAWIDLQADRLLGAVMFGLDLATAPLIAAGLQLHFTHLVLATAAADPQAFGRTDDAHRCPCCASLPTTSISRIGADASGYRYLHCSLCTAQWHMVRIKCSHCDQTKGIHYESLRLADGGDTPGGEAPRAAVEAEVCDECGHYLKIVHMERDAHVEPTADDLATVTLDLLVADAGYQRHGVNLLLLFGASEPGPDDGGGG